MPQHNLSAKTSAFLDSQCHEEEYLYHFLTLFATANKPLLPGMYSMFVHTVPKPNSTKLCIVVGHSTGPFTLNTIIPHEPITTRLDNIQDFG